MRKLVENVIELIVVSLLFPPVLVLINVAVAGSFLYFKCYFLIAFYVIWYFVSRNYDSQGGRCIQWLRYLHVWKLYAKYFPINLIKTAELDPNKNYLCGFHPHGYFAGVTINFVTEATGFSLKFPNIQSWILSLRLGFCLPFHREVALAFGIRNVSRESIQWLLTKEGVGNMVVLIPGGTQEMCYTRQNTFKLKLESRKGFIRLAIETGASLVPILSFGENDIYHVPESSSWLGRRIQRLQEHSKSPKSVFYGPFKWLPILPFRVPINTVVGKPIEVQPNKNPTDEEISALHKVYVDSLRQLYDEYKEKFGNGNVQLEIV